MQKRLTTEIIKKTEWLGTTKILRDPDLPGFFVSIGKNKKSYKIQKDIREDGKRRSIRRTIGSTDEISLFEARTHAKALLYDSLSNTTTCHGVGTPNSLEDLLKKIVVHEKSLTSKRHFEEKMRNLKILLPSANHITPKYITPEYIRNLHADILEKKSLSAANSAVRLVAYIKSRDNVGQMENISLEFLHLFMQKCIHEYSNQTCIYVDDLPVWFQNILSLRNPRRKNLHLFCLYSGLRPSLILRIENEWIDEDDGVINFPENESACAGGFTYPLSHQQVKLLSEIRRLGKIMTPKANLLFPATNGNGFKSLITREKKMPGKTGHVLRNTYRNIAQSLGYSTNDLRDLLDYKKSATFQFRAHEKSLRAMQQEISNQIDRLISSS